MHTQIITGFYKGRKLKLPESEAARPTRNRILQGAFNVLHSYLDFTDQTVLDICCGSGSWGLEALSRGASNATFIDTDTTTISANIKALGLEKSTTVIKADAKTFTPKTLATLVLTDPPYTRPDILESLFVNAAKIGHPQSLWLMETASDLGLKTPPNFTVLQTKLYGASAIHLWQFKG